MVTRNGSSVSWLIDRTSRNQRCAEGLGALPETELGEVIASAVRLCGFLNPIEARDVSATVLEALKMEDPIPEHR